MCTWYNNKGSESVSFAFTISQHQHMISQLTMRMISTSLYDDEKSGTGKPNISLLLTVNGSDSSGGGALLPCFPKA